MSQAAGSVSFPEPPAGIDWSIEIADAHTGQTHFSLDPQRQCRTASIGKIFLLIEVCTRFADGRLDPDAPLPIDEAHTVGDSGFLRWLRVPHVTIGDGCLLVGAVSDNLATNALITLCGLGSVRAVAPALGLQETSLWDYIRTERTPEMPWTPSFGTAAELGALMRMLEAGEVVSAEVSAMVLDYLATNVETAQVAGGLNIDALDHVESDDGIVLRHKTGLVSTVRADVGLASGPAAAVSYAVLANWGEEVPDPRIAVEDFMRSVGRAIRTHIRPQ